METTHRAIVGDSREMAAVDDASVELVVTSPPYPMIEMWDDTFAALDPEIGEHLAADEGRAAFDLMHDALAATWAEVERVLAPGGIACVNVGDATRSVGGEFALYPNHARVIEWFADRGFTVLPDVLWRKPTNSAAKFMGSGTLPPNAYVTLEHEYILVFRKGGPRTFDAGAERRYEAAFFWEERNEWFSDLWTDVSGRLQSLPGAVRDRSGAFPLEIPYRLIAMFSVYGDTVLDPFWGTGTTTLAAMAAGRGSVGYELEAGLAEAFEDRLDDLPARSREICRRRLDRHASFVAERREAGDEPGYTASTYGVPVVTRTERDLTLYAVEDVAVRDGTYVATHVPFDGGSCEP